MNYQIVNYSYSIKIANEAGVFYLMKETVKDISVVRGDTIKINSGDCLSSIFIRHRDVLNPVTASAEILVDLLNEMMSPPVEEIPNR